MQNECMNNEMRILNRKCETLSLNLSDAVHQRDKERSEITKLNAKLRQLQSDTEKVVRNLKSILKKYFLIFSTVAIFIRSVNIFFLNFPMLN